jgi:predicted RNA-binding protein with PUA-like domain
MAKKYWLVKQEPEAYSWDDFVGENGCEWDGVRNYQARNNLRAMSQDDFVLFYHSVIGKEVVGIATVEREAYPDPTATKGDWSAVDLRPFKPINRPVSLETIKNDPQLSEIPLVRNSRLSVMPLEAKHFRRVLKLGNTIL